uniref:Uncharacterized protein n=1 Tax=Cacopsylla melanoneura TaxID=428564 RepID=A0A8D8YUG1_9HEMI
MRKLQIRQSQNQRKIKSIPSLEKNLLKYSYLKPVHQTLQLSPAMHIKSRNVNLTLKQTTQPQVEYTALPKPNKIRYLDLGFHLAVRTTLTWLSRIQEEAKERRQSPFWDYLSLQRVTMR